MTQAHLTFQKNVNSFTVHVLNLEKLSVVQIQELELFVQNRKGIFDFHTYSFVLQKRIEFLEFKSLLMHANINAVCTEVCIVEKERWRVGFGQYKGMHYSDIPSSYLLWLKTNYHGPDEAYIDSELKKRKL
ncbi:DUF3820 family protein [Sulfurimonas sp. SAG-AH-194-I05]|nr:DUF3820 family protein [Sulfurimonas sp. SAG-AH-194-I05]MDF1875604.1 DUF3820 family protein [Sulfurimonas sp. SAG-AH-194-I05]